MSWAAEAACQGLESFTPSVWLSRKANPSFRTYGDQRALWEIIKERSSNVIRTWVFQWGSCQEMRD